jgi:hypothetical protein
VTDDPAQAWADWGSEPCREVDNALAGLAPVGRGAASPTACVRASANTSCCPCSGAPTRLTYGVVAGCVVIDCGSSIGGVVGWSRRCGLVSVLIALASVALLPASAGARPPIPALVYPGASSRVLGEVRARLGHDLRIVRATPARMRHNHRYRMLILDGDALSPGAVARRRRAIDRYMDGGGWVLALDVRAGHFARALDRLTHFSARPDGAERSSRAFLFRDAVVYGTPTVLMLDVPAVNPVGGLRTGSSVARAAEADQDASIAADLIATRLVHPNTGVDAPAPGDPDIPPYLRQREWNLALAPPGGNPVPVPAAYWTGSYVPPYPTDILGVPGQGQQFASWTVNHTFDVYLDDRASDVGAPYQIVTYNLAGEFTPTQPGGQFGQMYNPFTCRGIGQCEMYLERAWWTGLADVSVTPDPSTDAKLTVQATAPATPDSTASYTVGDDFSVGFSVSPEEGPGFNTSYEVKHEKTITVPDWGVANQSAGNTLAWEHSARNPCDMRPAAFNLEACFDPKGSQHTPRMPNELSRSQLQLAASGRWRTKQLLADSTSGTLNFSLATPVKLEDVYCDAFFFGSCVDNFLGGNHLGRGEWTTGPPTQTYSIDASAVAPVAMQSLEVAPNPVDGTQNQKATGTVTLAAPARIDTDVVIFSDDAHAVVGTPTGANVSRTVLTIPAGAASGTFTIATNDNKLPSGSSATAQITAYYGTAKVVQLKVTSE